MDKSNDQNTQNNLNNQNKWYRFPIKVTERTLYDALDGNVPTERWEMSYIDINVDTISAIRPYTHMGEEFVTGTLLYLTCGENWAVEVMPKKVREILNIKPFKVDGTES